MALDKSPSTVNEDAGETDDLLCKLIFEVKCSECVLLIEVTDTEIPVVALMLECVDQVGIEVLTKGAGLVVSEAGEDTTDPLRAVVSMTLCAVEEGSASFLFIVVL